MTTPNTDTTDSAATPSEAAPDIVTVRILKNGVHAAGWIFGAGAVARIPEPEARPLIKAGSAEPLY